MGIPSLQAAQAQFDPSTSNYQQFKDQYQQDVTNEALKQMDEQAAIAQQNLATQAQKAGAFGGSRMAVQEAELAKNLQDIKSRRIFQDLSQNFQQAQAKAMNTFESAAQRRLKAAPQFANVGRFQAGIGAQGAGLAANQFGLEQRGLGALFGIGQQQQALAQAQAAEQFRQDQETQQEGLKRLGFFSDILRGVPSSGQALTMQQPTFTNPLLGALGLGLGTFNILGGDVGSGGFDLIS
jgi:predicted O-linked N-acetylglucosamine transferase (SPINDLY family)